jgi:2-methylaconitate cis-trans-isomerase PrpF
MAAIDGDLELDGVAGTAAPIRLEFLDPAGAGTGKLLPTGHAIDHLKVDGLGEVEVSLIDATNACMFVAAASMGITGLELPVEMERNTELLVRLDAMRCLASVAMGLTSSIEEARRMPTAPKVAMVAPAAAARTLGGKTLEAGDMDIHVRMISSGQPHRATELTGAMCLAAACRVPGSVPHRMLLEAAHTGPVRIGHPSGVVLVDSAAEMQGDAIHIRHATVYRTARRLFQGEVFYRVPTALALAAE